MIVRLGGTLLLVAFILGIQEYLELTLLRRQGSIHFDIRCRSISSRDLPISPDSVRLLHSRHYPGHCDTSP